MGYRASQCEILERPEWRLHCARIGSAELGPVGDLAEKAKRREQAIS